MKHIEIKIDPEGKVTIEGVGFVGKSCDEKMRAFEQELGTVKSRKNSPEYLQSAAVSNQQKVGQ